MAIGPDSEPSKILKMLHSENRWKLDNLIQSDYDVHQNIEEMISFSVRYAC